MSIHGPKSCPSPPTDLPDLSATYPISDKQVDQYWADGFIVLEEVLSPEEVAAYGAGIRRDAMKCFEGNNMETEFGGSLLQKLNLRLDSEVMRHYCLSRRLGRNSRRGASGWLLWRD